MTERDYILVSNLAHLRGAQAILRDFFVYDGDELLERDRLEITAPLARLIQRLERQLEEIEMEGEED